jgi:hypothetical protein
VVLEPLDLPAIHGSASVSAYDGVVSACVIVEPYQIHELPAALLTPLSLASFLALQRVWSVPGTVMSER